MLRVLKINEFLFYDYSLLFYYLFFCNYSGSPAAEEWGLWCGGEAAIPQPPIPLQTE